MEIKSVWEKYDQDDLEKLGELAEGYKRFISECKTERECVMCLIDEAEELGYISLQSAIESGEQLKPGSKVYASVHGKALVLAHIGKVPMEKGLNILGAHIDSPRLDIKQNPLYEKDGLALLDTHYYGGIKNYQWVALPLALHGVVVKKDGFIVDICIGEDEDDPVFCVTDLLPHLGRKQMEKNANNVIEGEDLDLLVGNQVAFKGAADSEAGVESGENAGKEAKKNPVSAFLLDILKEKYGIEEADFLSAELEVVPAGPARDLGLDASMVIGYGQDDRACAYTSAKAQFQLALKDGDDAPERTAVCILTDKEEVGSIGATGMDSLFFENVIAEIMELAGEGGNIKLMRALSSSHMLSSDVSAGVDPAYNFAYETKNAAFMGHGMSFNKYTGVRGKNGSNDARAEYVASLRNILDKEHVSFQTAELGGVDVGGGGTIAYLSARYGMDVIDSGVPVLSMHSPWEVTSKADIYETYRGYIVFQKYMQ